MSDIIFNPNEKEYENQTGSDSSALSKLIMKCSGGKINSQEQINKALVIIAVSAVILTIIVLAL